MEGAPTASQMEELKIILQTTCILCDAGNERKYLVVVHLEVYKIRVPLAE